MSDKVIALGFVTYPVSWFRVDYLTKAILSARQWVTASRDKLLLFATCEIREAPDPLSSGFHLRKNYVVELCQRHGIVLAWNRKAPSMGANENNAMRFAFDELRADYLLVHIDDCYANTHVDLSDGIDFLEANPDVDILRYHWSGRKEARPTFHARPDGFMQVDPASKWFYDDSPHVRRPNCAEKFGWHKEGTPDESGPIERDMNRRLLSQRANIVAVPETPFGKDGPKSASRA